MLNCTLLDDYQNMALSLTDWSSLRPAVQTRSLQQHIADDETLIATLADSDIFSEAVEDIAAWLHHQPLRSLL